MYGIVNKAIEEMVTEKFGVETWLKIKEKSKVKDDFFVNNESYPDQVTFDLAISASQILNITISDVLIEFGKYWILNTGKKHYGALLATGGHNLKDFLINLPNFHSRVMLMYPKLQPPEFKVEQLDECSIHLHYFSHRDGLRDFVVGLIQGLSEMFNTPVKINTVKSKSEGHSHEVFKISWN